MKHYDVIVVGGGPGGYEAAIRCAQLKLHTAVIEKDKLGGTCLNRGCIPTKAFVHSAGFLKELKISRKLGIDAGEPNVDIRKLVMNKNKIVRTLVSGVGYLMKKNGIDVYSAEARFVDRHMLMAGEEELSFDYLILATGSSANFPPIPGIDSEGIMTSTEILDIDHIPARLTILGGGVIGCELACVFREFGSQVTIVDVLDHLLPMVDRDLSDVMVYSISCEGVKVITGARVTSIEKRGGSPGAAGGQGSRGGEFHVKVVTAEGAMEIVSDDLLAAMGRKANNKGLDVLGLETERGYVKVDEHMRTNIPNIYAIGDLTGKIQLAHVASAQGVAAAENIAGGNSTVNYDAVPNCIFTVPEIASVGLTEEEAQRRGIDCIVGKFPMRASGRAMTLHETDGFTKIISEKGTGKVIGAGVIGVNATEVIGELALAVQTGRTLDDIESTIHAHPTIGETIHEAALAALGKPMSF